MDFNTHTKSSYTVYVFEKEKQQKEIACTENIREVIKNLVEEATQSGISFKTLYYRNFNVAKEALAYKRMLEILTDESVMDCIRIQNPNYSDLTLDLLSERRN